jgi:hypothetical protein
MESYLSYLKTLEMLARSYWWCIPLALFICKVATYIDGHFLTLADPGFLSGLRFFLLFKVPAHVKSGDEGNIIQCIVDRKISKYAQKLLKAYDRLDRVVQPYREQTAFRRHLRSLIRFKLADSHKDACDNHYYNAIGLARAFNYQVHSDPKEY